MNSDFAEALVSRPPSEVRPGVVADSVDIVYVRRRNGQEVLAVQDMDAHVGVGEFVSIVGPSGCGKTSFLNVASGSLAPTRGSVRIFGKDSRDPTVSRAMVFQDASLMPWYSVRRNIGYGLECRRVPKAQIEARIAPLLSMVGLDGFGNHYPHELSGGMQQRVNLARALAVDPDLLLMDEPFAALDAQTREIMQAELLRVWEATRKTVLFITHQIDEAIFLSDRVIVMSARPGRVLADLTVNLPRPRGLAIKRSMPFLELSDHIWSLLEQEVRKSLDMQNYSSGDAG